MMNGSFGEGVGGAVDGSVGEVGVVLLMGLLVRGGVVLSMGMLVSVPVGIFVVVYVGLLEPQVLC